MAIKSQTESFRKSSIIKSLETNVCVSKFLKKLQRICSRGSSTYDVQFFQGFFDLPTYVRFCPSVKTCLSKECQIFVKLLIQGVLVEYRIRFNTTPLLNRTSPLWKTNTTPVKNWYWNNTTPARIQPHLDHKPTHFGISLIIIWTPLIVIINF
jgi:hypothetical protein